MYKISSLVHVQHKLVMKSLVFLHTDLDNKWPYCLTRFLQEHINCHSMQILIDFVPLILHVNQKKTYYKISHNICFTQAYNTTRRSSCVIGKALLVLTVVRPPGKWRSWVYKRMVWGPTWYRVLWWPEISEERLSLCEVSWQPGKKIGAKLVYNRIC